MVLIGLVVFWLIGCAATTPLQPPIVQTSSARIDSAPEIVSVNLTDAFGAEGSGPGEFKEPLGLVVGRDGFVYVADSGNDRIQIFAPDGTFADEIGRFGWRLGEFDAPVALALSPGQRPILYVAERGNRRVQACELRNKRYRVVVRDLPDDPFEPSSIAVGRRGDLYVADVRKHRILKITPQGAIEWTRGSYGWGPYQFREPGGIATDGAGGLLVADTGNARLQRLDFAGNPRATWTDASDLPAPGPIARDRYGYWYVSDPRAKHIAVLDDRGTLLLTFGGDELTSPGGIAISRDGLAYVSDRAANRVFRYRIVYGVDGTLHAPAPTQGDAAP